MNDKTKEIIKRTIKSYDEGVSFCDEDLNSTIKTLDEIEQGLRAINRRKYDLVLEDISKTLEMMKYFQENRRERTAKPTTKKIRS